MYVMMLMGSAAGSVKYLNKMRKADYESIGRKVMPHNQTVPRLTTQLLTDRSKRLVWFCWITVALSLAMFIHAH